MIQTIEQNGNEFVLIEDKLEYLEIYYWLTSVYIKDIWVNDKKIHKLSTVDAKIAILYLHTDKNIFLTNEWLWRYNIYNGNVFYYIKFKFDSITDYPYSPIPKVLYDFYTTHKKLVDYHQ